MILGFVKRARMVGTDIGMLKNYLMEKIFVSHLYRIRKNLSKLKEEIDLYPEIKDEEYINKAISFKKVWIHTCLYYLKEREKIYLRE